jgi:hypothetical protein
MGSLPDATVAFKENLAGPVHMANGLERRNHAENVLDL